MKLNSYCMCCLVNRQEENIRKFEDSAKQVDYIKHVMRRLADATDEDCAPNVSIELKKFFSEYWGVPMKDYSQIKREYNQLCLDLLPELREKVRAAADPLEKAMVYSRIGNYIDFNAIANVNKETALEMLEAPDSAPSAPVTGNTPSISDIVADTCISSSHDSSASGSAATETTGSGLEPIEYAHFLSDLSTAKELVYLTDNCGEVALDRLVLEVLKEKYPELSITVVVRGKESANDATMEDAEMCGITEIVPVMGNGSGVGGTWFGDINEETKALLHRADLIISKGQGNFETLHECGLNIYYLFLCKCARFQKLFHAEFLQGMFVNENRI